MEDGGFWIALRCNAPFLNKIGLRHPELVSGSRGKPEMTEFVQSAITCTTASGPIDK